MNFANLSLLTMLLLGVSANGVGNLLSINSPHLVEHTTMRANFFAARVVKHSFAPSPALFIVK